MMINFGDPRLPERFWNKVSPEPNTGCWFWTASHHIAGYGWFRVAGKTRTAHSVAYEALHGNEYLAGGLELDHACRVPECCNPAHLDPVTHGVNMQRSPLGFMNRETQKMLNRRARNASPEELARRLKAAWKTRRDRYGMKGTR